MAAHSASAAAANLAALRQFFRIVPALCMMPSFLSLATAATATANFGSN
jgi:hypothetical protein